MDFFALWFAISVMAGMMLFLVVFFSFLIYVSLKGTLTLTGMPNACKLEEVKFGQILLNLSNQHGRNIKVVQVILDNNCLGGGFILTSDNESIRVPSATLILVS